jgi:hypothetical protein
MGPRRKSAIASSKSNGTFTWTVDETPPNMPRFGAWTSTKRPGRYSCAKVAPGSTPGGTASRTYVNARFIPWLEKHREKATEGFDK